MQRPSDPALWARLQEICARLPDVSEKISHGELAWSAGRGRKARQFATTWDHHHDDRNGIVLAASPGVQDELVATEPDRYFRPPYVGSRGWIGMWLDTGEVDWDLVERHLVDAHATITGA